MRTRIWKGTVLLLSIQVISPFIPPSGARADSFDVTVVRGLSTIGNPFDHGSNLISEVLANVPEGTQLYKFDASGQGWKVNLFQFGAWVHPEQKLAPGEGAFLRNPTNDFSVTFSGARPSNFVVPVHPGFNLVSVPGDGTNNLSQIDYDYILPFNSSRQQYDESINYVEGAGWFTSTGQVYSLVRAGEAFIYHRGSVSEPVPTPLSTTIFLNNYGPGSTTHAPITSTYGCFWNT